MIKQFYFKQFNSSLVICLHTVWIPNTSIWFLDKTLSGAITADQSGPGSNGNEGVLHIPLSSKTWAYHQMVCVISGHSLQEGRRS